MTLTDAQTGTSGLIVAGDVEILFERRGGGPDALLIGGPSDPAEAWAPQLEGLAHRYRLTAFDNRGAGRSPLAPEDFTVGRHRLPPELRPGGDRADSWRRTGSPRRRGSQPFQERPAELNALVDRFRSNMDGRG